MTTRLSRERAVADALDHLHTAAPALARFASKAEVDASTLNCVDATTSGADVETSIIEPSSVSPQHTATPLATPNVRLTRAERLQLHREAVARRNNRLRVGFSNWRRFGAAMAALLFAGLGSATFAGSIATAGTALKANSVVAYGGAPDLGSGADLALHAPVIGMAGDPKHSGYWLAAADGGVFAFGKARFYGSIGGTTLNSPIVGIAAAPNGRGYWLVGADGGVFAFGKAGYYGSMGGVTLAAPVVSIVSTPDGRGYWLFAADGGVFTFGDAPYLGSAAGLHLARPIVSAAATPSGAGYWMLGADGGVFSFGSASFEGALPDAAQNAVGIAASPKGHGYWIAHADGSVDGFGTALRGNTAVSDGTSAQPPTVAIAAGRLRGYWIAQGAAAPEAPSLANDPFLACTRAHESNSAGGYQAVSAGGTYRGAYQFDRGTWNSAARLANRPDLVGVDPAMAAPADQDLLAMALFHARGAQPWGNRCSGLT
jgi:hypothetical protein